MLIWVEIKEQNWLYRGMKFVIEDKTNKDSHSSSQYQIYDMHTHHNACIWLFK